MSVPAFASAQEASSAPQEDPLTSEIVASKGFQEYHLQRKGDWITFYLHAPEHRPLHHLVLFLSGSTPDPCFSYERKDGKVVSYFWGHRDFASLPPDYAFVVIAKRGVEGAFDEAAPARPTPALYLQKNSLDYRVWQADQVIDYCCRKLLTHPGKVIVYGHSEGAPVAAKLGTVNRRITHLGFWCGNGLPDYYEFALMRRKQVWQGKMTEAEAQKEIDGLFDDYRNIFAAPNDVQGHNGSRYYTNRRWTSYAEPPVQHLLRIDIPIYVQVATRDESAPIETTYIVPLEFTRFHKRNLTYQVGVGWDHSLNEIDASGNKTSHWDEVFRDFIRWTDANGAGTKEKEREKS